MGMPCCDLVDARFVADILPYHCLNQIDDQPSHYAISDLLLVQAFKKGNNLDVYRICP